jgi:hypothetical protein
MLRWLILRHPAPQLMANEIHISTMDDLPKIPMPLTTMSTAKMNSAKSFTVTTGSRTIELRAPDAQKAEEWFSAVKADLTTLKKDTLSHLPASHSRDSKSRGTAIIA